MANIKEVRHNGKSYLISDKQARQNIGDLSKLQTTDKRSLVNAVNEIKATSSCTTGGTTDYSELSNKPKINGVELVGNKTLEELGINTSSDSSEGGNSGGSCDCIIEPIVTPNLWNGEYKQGKLNYNTGAIDETASSYYAEMELEANTDYVVYCGSLYVLYPENMAYNKANYHTTKSAPTAFNSGSFRYIRFWVSAPSATNAHLAKQFYLIKGTTPMKVGKQEAYFLPSDIQGKSFYRSVPYKLRDLGDPFKPTAVAMAGDSITQGVHSANHADIENCYAKLFGDYILERFNEKVHNIPMFDERVERYGSSTYWSGETGIVLQDDAYTQMDFYGAYVAVNTYNGTKPTDPIEIYIDGQLHTTFNFAENDATMCELTDLTMDYHTIKVKPVTGKAVLASFSIKKYVTFANRGVSGITSIKIRDYHANSHLFDNDDIVFCMIGTNDRGAVNPALYDFNVRQVFKHGLEAMGKQVIIMSGPPAPREYYDVSDEKSDADLPNKMRDVVAWVNAIAGKENEEVISFYNWLIDYALEQNRPLDEFFNDGLHPTEECYYLMYEHLVRECGWGIETTTVSASD